MLQPLHATKITWVVLKACVCLCLLHLNPASRVLLSPGSTQCSSQGYILCSPLLVSCELSLYVHTCPFHGLSLTWRATVVSDSLPHSHSGAGMCSTFFVVPCAYHTPYHAKALLACCPCFLVKIGSVAAHQNGVDPCVANVTGGGVHVLCLRTWVHSPLQSEGGGPGPSVNMACTYGSPRAQCDRTPTP